MKVKELLEMFKGKEEYEININDEEDFEIEFDDDSEIVNISIDSDDEDYDLNNSWRNSNYESKDIDDWDVDDHLASWYDHMMEK